MHPELFRIPGTRFMVPSYGAMVAIAFLVGTWWMCRRARKVKADPDICLSLALICLVFGWVGGRTFYVIHYWKSQFAQNPAQILNLTSGGFEIYGGLIVGAICCIIYLLIKRVSIRLYADLTAPTLLFGMGVGRIGCFLVGCCWGATCDPNLPWAVTFPALSSPQQQQWQERLVTMPAELILVDSVGIAVTVPQQMLKLTPEKTQQLREKLKRAGTTLAEAEAAGDQTKVARARFTEAGIRLVLDHMAVFDTSPEQLRELASSKSLRSVPVHPAQLYSAIGPLLLAALASAYFYRRKRHGTVMAMTMMLYAVERFIEEMIRADNPHDTFGLTVSQGISLGIFAFGLGWLLVLRKMPLRSPRPATRAVPPGTPEPVTA